jgi:membrane protease YdiL (CAAX protease family)
VGVYGPSLAAIILTGYLAGWQGVRKFLKRITIWRVGLRWYAFLLFGFVAIEMAGYGLYRLLGGPALDIAVPTLVSVLPVLLVQILIPGLGEEFGWRGFALPRLQAKWGPIAASVVLSLIHLLWHSPTYWLGTGIHNVPLILVILWVIPWTILFVWVYNNTQGSILIAVLYHALFGVTLSFMPFFPPESVVPITPALIVDFSLNSIFGPYMATTALFWVAAIIVVVATGGRLGYSD